MSNAGTGLKIPTLFAKKGRPASVEIYSESESENVGFHVEGILPGYSETQYFRVRVYYEEDITVHYVIDITDGEDGILAEILQTGGF